MLPWAPLWIPSPCRANHGTLARPIHGLRNSPSASDHFDTSCRPFKRRQHRTALPTEYRWWGLALTIELTLMFDSRQMCCTDLCDSLVTKFSGDLSWHFPFWNPPTNLRLCSCFYLSTPNAYKCLQILRRGVLRSPHHDPHRVAG